WPPSCNSNYLEYSLVVFRTAALLAALTYPSHILVYAPRDKPCWPPSCNSNYLEYSLVVFRTAALLAALGAKVAQVKVFGA
ncbi:hypothetical protein, partial [Providencia huaxiensis]|uniref:hypothetical protein n=1 Tax=Providencia huaxiensis TaxID=2027290 RepID=UPI002FE201AF